MGARYSHHLFIAYMQPKTPNHERWIALSECPKHPNLFFMGPGATRITLYSQQVRALALIHALTELKRITAGDQIAIIGAGAAGICAASACALVGADVDLFESGTDVLPLQSGSPRLLHPHIYEWPLRGSLQEDAVLPILDWSASKGAEVRNQLKTNLDMLRAGDIKVRSHLRWTLEELKRENDEWVLSFRDDKGDQRPRVFSHVILAVGFGEERSCGSSPKLDYWRHAGPATDQVEMAMAKYFISGSGDGGLTDLLGVLIKGFNHVEFTKAFLVRLKNNELADAVLQAEATVLNGQDLFAAFELHIQPLLEKRGLMDWIGSQLRDDRTVMFNAEVFLAKGRAARLNQVMVFTLVKATELVGGKLSFSIGKVLDVAKLGDAFVVKGPLENGNAIAEHFDHVILRHGPHLKERYQFAGPFFEDYQAHFKDTILARPQWAEIPRLASETFEFYDVLMTAQTSDPAVREARAAEANERQKTILLTWDPASQQVVQQGCEDLLEVLRNVEQSNKHWTLMLSISAEHVEPYREILDRIARASQNRLHLQIVPIGRRSSYSAEPMPQVQELWNAMDDILIHIIDARLHEVVKEGRCERLGDVHHTIGGILLAGWAAWRSSFDSDQTLLAEFLRLLFQVELAGKDRWDGDHASLPDLVAAVVMMLAANAAEPLTPSQCSPGNLSFGLSAIGLGSGCATIEGRPLEDYGDPRRWNVDALFLSTARQEMFQADDLITEAGESPTSLFRATRVNPVVIPNTKKWRRLLSGDLAAWMAAVEDEFIAWRQRQTAVLQED